MLSGKWTFRSFRNETKLVGADDGEARLLVAIEGVLDFESAGEGRFRGALGLSAGDALIAEGSAAADAGGFSLRLEGVAGTPTGGRLYQGEGALVPAGAESGPDLLVGTIRHAGPVQGGERTAFVAVRHPLRAPPRTARRSILTAGL